MERRKESEGKSRAANSISRKDWVAEALAVAKKVTTEREHLESEELVRKPNPES